jgi:hypothetical protein
MNHLGIVSKENLYFPAGGSTLRVLILQVLPSASLYPAEPNWKATGECSLSSYYLHFEAIGENLWT